MVKPASSLLLVILLVAACGKEAAPPPPALREPIGTMYVVSEKLVVREKPVKTAPELTTYRYGETVSLLDVEGEWVEIRLLGDATGWVKKTQLSSYEPPSKDEGSGPGVPASAGSSSVRFRKAPSPVYSEKRVNGEIVFEAAVDLQGRVTSVRTLRNTTGSRLLESKNQIEITRASFYPLVVNGRPRTFIYEYRVSY